MNTREQLIKKLNFDRFNVHVRGKEVEKDIAEAKQLIDQTDLLSIDELKTLSKQVGIYYLFFVRDKALALTYLNKYQSLVPKESQEYAEACNFIGHANTIDGSYKDDSLFNKALDGYSVLEKTRDVQLAQAFAFRYIGLMYHRNKESQKALDNIELAIKIQSSFEEEYPLVKIDLAESLHIQGVIQARQNKLEEAEQLLLKAQALEQAFCEHTHSDHFLKFITMQSLGSVWLRQNKTNDY